MAEKQTERARAAAAPAAPTARIGPSDLRIHSLGSTLRVLFLETQPHLLGLGTGSTPATVDAIHDNALDPRTATPLVRRMFKSLTGYGGRRVTSLANGAVRGGPGSADWRRGRDLLPPRAWHAVLPNLGPDVRRNGVTTGGGGGIRTRGRLAPSLVFKTSAFDHSATPPGRR